MNYLSTIRAQQQPLCLSVKGTDTPMRGARFPRKGVPLPSRRRTDVRCLEREGQALTGPHTRKEDPNPIGHRQPYRRQRLRRSVLDVLVHS